MTIIDSPTTYTTEALPTPANIKLMQRLAEFVAKLEGYPVIGDVDSVDPETHTVEVCGPVGEIWQKRVRVDIDALTDKQVVEA